MKSKRVYRIYISGALTNDPQSNIQKAIEVAERLWQAGYYPYVPHLLWFWHERFPHEHNEWLEYDFAWLEICDAVFVIDENSEGVRKELQKARALGIPVVRSIDELRKLFDIANNANV
jgi:ribosomal protein S2